MNLQALHPTLQRLTITLDETQLNVGGERSLMSPDKFVLLGTKQDTKQRIVIKYSDQPLGRDEIKKEHEIRKALDGIPFASEKITMPEELYYSSTYTHTISITTFVEQERVFTDYSLEQQFFMAIKALEAQESFHVTTREHRLSIISRFTAHTPAFYLESYQHMARVITTTWPHAEKLLADGAHLLTQNAELLKMYDNHLIHTDFVPHNFRIQNQQIFLLDFVSFRLGNKYESWARFINFMELHNPELVPLLVHYVRQDRGEEEARVLKLLRIYKTCFLLHYYVSILAKTDGDLRALTTERLHVWTAVLEAILKETSLSPEVLVNYYKKRDTLRTDAEKERQRQFTWA